MTDTKLTFVCPNCNVANRVPQSRLTDQPICGKCHHMLIAGQPITLDDENFDKFVARTSIPLVVDFWAPWCPPCRMMGPAFAAAAAELSPDFLLAKLDTEQAPDTAVRLNITGIPCLVAFKSGQEAARQSGAMNTQQIIQWVRSL